MSIKLDEKDFIIKFWRAESFKGNALMILLRRREGTMFIDCRVRQKKDDKIWNSIDEKVFYHWKVVQGTTEDEALKKCNDLWFETTRIFSCHCFSQVINGDVPKFIEMLKQYTTLYHEKRKKI